MTAAHADQLLTVKAVAQRLSIGLMTAYRRIYDNEIAWVNVAGKNARRASIRVSESALAEYQQRCQR